MFNKGRLLNAAFRFVDEEMKEEHIDCIIFHDVDMLPEDDRIPYRCCHDGSPMHLGGRVNTLKYQCVIN